MSNELTGYSVSIVKWASHHEFLVAIRDQVFIVEQNVPEDLERDPMDAKHTHAIATDSTGNHIGTGRLLDNGVIGRMAVLKAWRGKGVGQQILLKLVDSAKQKGLNEVTLGAQIHAIGFYQGLGFTPFGEEFMDAGIPHMEMRLVI